MRDRSGYICDRSEIGQRPPLQRVYSSATFEQLLTQFARHGFPANIPAISCQPKTWPESFCLEKTASQPCHHQQGRWILCRTSATDADAGHEFCRPGNPPASAFWLVMGVDDLLGGVIRLNGTLYPAFAVPSADNRHLVISALTDKGLRYAGYGVAVNHDADSHISPGNQN